MVEIIIWFTPPLAILGAVLNSYKRIEGFYVWLITNTILLIEAFQKDNAPHALLWAAYIIICLNGIKQWKE